MERRVELIEARYSTGRVELAAAEQGDERKVDQVVVGLLCCRSITQPRKALRAPIWLQT
jgi:hypothetical protein